MPRAVWRFFDCITKKMKTKLLETSCEVKFMTLEVSRSISSRKVAIRVIATRHFIIQFMDRWVRKIRFGGMC